MCHEKSKAIHKGTNETNAAKDDNLMKNKGIGDAGSTADLRMLWSAIVCLGLGLL